jgi:hypothetical protein
MRFQQIAGGFTESPPVPGVGPGAMADPRQFLQQLTDVGVESHVKTEPLEFNIDSFAMAWAVFADMTTAKLPEYPQGEAKDAVLGAMWPSGEGPVLLKMRRNLSLEKTLYKTSKLPPKELNIEIRLRCCGRGVSRSRYRRQAY